MHLGAPGPGTGDGDGGGRRLQHTDWEVMRLLTRPVVAGHTQGN